MKKKHIKYLVMDVDGTLTDGKIYMGHDGELGKAFHIKDGCGIHDLLIPSGSIPIIMTGRKSAIYQGITDKLAQLSEIADELSAVAYIGDDINDLLCMRAVKEAGGIVGCPQDAAKEVRKIADFISENKGGEGAVRDFIEWINMLE